MKDVNITKNILVIGKIMRNWDVVPAALAVAVSIIVVVVVAVDVAVVDNLHNHFGLGEGMPQLN